MNPHRMEQIKDNALAWIWDHCDCAGGIEDYIEVLKDYILMTRDEIADELSNCGYSNREIERLLSECGIYY